ncbi:glycerol-3-phosphate dehydrogenase [Denitrobaculum tricleocarpae]|uniref:Glycerol-3-phosphate dehydrogenase n=1 Tax=Denitrobaculum tricleocarpae TaxID=2591009 RepID=A0A545U2Q2_9PROT|nr:glycerol-3-phosphate dehydrogenase [Denitrobaculum tricleocarpae]TQV83757.1 glycerol-3-phosphate dehydrogenase [Denitrobaculum tricleocarpae]
MAQDKPLDIVVIGGGVNGTGIARDAAGRGLSVLLCEKSDLGSGTSSASTKLIHGGLRYLEQYEFRLVRESLMEREVLLRAAPHIIWPMRFVLPHNKSLRPAWMIRLGLFLYDHLGGRKLLPGSEGVKLADHPSGGPLKDDMTKGFVYSDCWVQDARLVVLNAIDARERGAEVLTRTECVSARRVDELWEIELRDLLSGQMRKVSARALVNAAGPWVASVLEQRVGSNRAAGLRMIKGSHIVVPAMFDHDYSYIFQNPDGRIVFAIPYEEDYTLVGTTDVEYEGDPAQVACSEDEISYLCNAVNEYFKSEIAPKDVVWTYSGVRPLYDDASQNASTITRDYVLDLDEQAGRAPMLSVFGGKITTFRKLAEHAMEKLCPLIACSAPDWTATAMLPGGDIGTHYGDVDFDAFVERFKKQHAWLPQELAWRYARNYGARAAMILGDAKDLSGLGQELGDGIYEAELSYLVEQEWLVEGADLLWRRSKLGLHVSKETAARIESWLAQHALAGRRAG